MMDIGTRVKIKQSAIIRANDPLIGKTGRVVGNSRTYIEVRLDEGDFKAGPVVYKNVLLMNVELEEL